MPLGFDLGVFSLPSYAFRQKPASVRSVYLKNGNRPNGEWVMRKGEWGKGFKGGKRKGWGERWDSNPRPPEPQSGALPTELRSPLL